MGTRVDEVYDVFLHKINDFYIANNLTDEEVEHSLSIYLSTASARFVRCRKSLALDATKENFIETLEPIEIDILTSLMVVVYLEPQLVTSDLIKQALSDKDFKIYSQANHINQLKDLVKTIKGDANKSITQYTYYKKMNEGDKNGS